MSMKLSPKSHATVAATAAVVAAHADQITATFYPAMFAAHPELDNIFNAANQAIGEQPKALAASVVAFAVQLIDPDAPDFTPVMQRIAHKHVSLGIRAGEYTIVGRHLMEAIHTVLGDAVTPDIAQAWDEVYWLFATELIAEEARMYAIGGVDPEHPWRKYRVVERTEDGTDVFSLTLQPVEGEMPEYRTGQYVAISVELPTGVRQPRQFTISSGPRGESMRITVKRVFGVNGSPDGDVLLDDTDAPLVLVSAGIGITPIAAIMNDVSRNRPDRTVRLFHADKSHDQHPLYGELRAQVQSMSDARGQNWYEEGATAAPTLAPAKSGYMDLTGVDVPVGAKVFMCGPLPFMQSARRELMEQGVPSNNIHYEVFTPDMWAQSPA